jgi:REP element-mobilizing transposase RayT
MRGSYTQLYVHLVWSTWDRLPLVTPAIQEQVYACIIASCEKLSVQVIAIGGIEDHVHLLVRIPSTVSIAEVVKQVKGASSHLVTHVLVPGEFFKWQGAYGAFAISKNHVNRVRDYVLNQKEHHRERRLISELERTERPQPDE